MPGHEKFLKTSMRTVSGHFPDYVIVVIDSNKGPQAMTVEHLGICAGLKIPFFFVLTKIDCTQEAKALKTKAKCEKAMKNPLFKKPTVTINSIEDVKKLDMNDIQGGFLVPIFQLSAKSGLGVDALRTFLSLVPPSISRTQLMKSSQMNPKISTKIVIDDKFLSKTAGIILGGTVINGKVKAGDFMMVGPDKGGNFNEVRIVCIHCERVEIDEATEG